MIIVRKRWTVDCPAGAEEVVSDAVVVGSSDELKIRDGAIGNAVPMSVWKWQL